MDLEPVEQRILGSLLEKQVTVACGVPAHALQPAHRLQPDQQP